MKKIKDMQDVMLLELDILIKMKIDYLILMMAMVKIEL